jgi:hypothetical protein
MYRTTARRARASIPRRTAAGGRSRVLASVAVAALTVSGVSLVADGPAAAATATVDDATLAWGLNGEQGGAAFIGGCNFLSAGTAGSTGSSRPWTEADGFYSTQDGNVTVEKPDAAGNYAQPTWATKCQDPNGNPVSVGSTTSLTGNRVVFRNGTGTVDPGANTATIHWTGSFTSVFYGGYTYWSAADPTLTVNADGTGTLTATASGYGADMNDPSQWVPLEPTTITLANLHGVTVTDTGFTVTPDYLGVSVTVPDGATPQAPRTSSNAAFWGSFPQSFVDFQQLTGQSSYWYTSGGSRDPAKPATPLTVTYTAETGPVQTAPTITTQPADATVPVGGTATFTAAASGDPTPTVQWQLLAPGTSTWVDYPGATGTTFHLNVPALGYHGSRVRAVFTNAAGSAVTNEVTLTVTAGADDSQTITVTVPEQGEPGSFTWTIDGTSRAVTLTEAVNHGAYLQSTGDLVPVTVTDTRSAGPAWSVSGQLADFNNGALSGKYLGWTPRVLAAGAGAVAGGAVQPGLTTGNGLKDTAVLASAPDGHEPGSARIGAGLDLRIPATTPAGTYTTTLTLTALS